jgi:large subunit ribosomal protein L9
VDRRSVRIDKPIKTLGSYTVGVRLHDAVTAHVKLTVNAA